MFAYIIRRLSLAVPTLLLVSMIIFLLVRFIPGDILDVIAMSMEGRGSKMDRAAVQRELGLDVPIVVQYGRWIGVLPGQEGAFEGIIQGNLGDSLWKRTPIMDEVLARWPITLELGLMGVTIGLVIAVPIGVYSAMRQDSWGDYIGRSFAILCISVPGFWVATMIIVFPSIWWGYAPPILLIPFMEDPLGNLRMFVLPAATLGMVLSGVTMRMLRGTMLEVLRQDYIRTAWSKGLVETTIVRRHALKNALIPVITLVGFQIPIMVGGTVIIETIFNLPGMGQMLWNAALNRDYPIVSGVMFIIGFVVLMNNLVIDLTYAYLDPRIRIQ